MYDQKTNGIICDLCSTRYDTDFTYYSYDSNDYMVSNNRTSQLMYDEPSKHSVDVCSKCHERVSESVIKNYSPKPEYPDGSRPAGIVCELTGEHLIGSYKFWHTNVSKITIQQLSGKTTSKIEKRILDILSGQEGFDNQLNKKPTEESTKWI